MKKESNEEFRERKVHKRRRAQALRDLLEVESDNPLKDRDLRNHLEHFDERLDHWAVTSERQNMVQDFVGKPEMIKGIEASDRMRTFDPSRAEFVFRGKHYDIQELVSAIESLESKATSELDQLMPGLTESGPSADREFNRST